MSLEIMGTIYDFLGQWCCLIIASIIYEARNLGFVGLQTRQKSLIIGWDDHIHMIALSLNWIISLNTYIRGSHEFPHTKFVLF